MGEAAVLAAQGGGTAAVALAVEELALAGVGGVGVVAIAKELTGESAKGAGPALVERCAETRHRFPPKSGQQPAASSQQPAAGSRDLVACRQQTIEKPRALARLFAVSELQNRSIRPGGNSFFAPYYQDTKSSTKTRQISLRV
jgi:hypothetical protein